MQLEVLGNKPVIGNTENELKLELTYPSVQNLFQYRNSYAVAVKPSESMRPDMLSMNFFGVSDSWDMLLKYNGISNPFSINEGDYFFSPEIDELRSNMAPSGRQVREISSIRDQYINPEKKSMVDSRLAIIEAQRLEAMKKKSEASSVKGNLLPPNVASPGDREIVVRGGKIYFGKDVVKGLEECEEPISKSEFLAKLIKNRIKR
jgi:hypothetical protein